MRVLARDGVAKVHSITAPLLVVSFVLVLAVHIPHVGVSVNGARRWIGPGAAPVPALRADEARAGALLGDAAGQAPAARARPARARAGRCCSSSARRCLLVFTQPDLGTAMVIAFTVSAMLIAAGMPLRKLGADRRRGARRWCSCTRSCDPYARARLTSFLDPWAHASSSGFQAVQGQIAIGSGGLFGVGPGPVGAEDLLPARGADRLHPRGDRRGARRGRRVRAAVPVRADRLRGPAGGEGGAQPLQRPDRGRRDRR